MRWVFLLLLLLLFFPLVSANTIELRVEETGKVTSYLNTYWVVQVNGTGTITNPSSRDLFDVRLFFDILNLDIEQLGGDGVFDSTSVAFDRIPAGGNQQFDYRIVGITTEPPTLTGRGVLYTGFAKRTTRIYSDTFGELQKAPLEDPSVTNRNARLISLTLSNPTEFQFTIESLRVIKTSDLNPNNVLDVWYVVNDSAPRILDPDGFFVHDFLDYNATEGEVYWLENEVFISRVDLIDNNTIERLTEQNLTNPIEILNFTNETTNITRDFIVDDYGLQKQVDASVVLPGVPVTVRLLLYNFGGKLAEYELSDELPAGFSANSELRWSGQIPTRNTVVLEYQAVLNDSVTAGLDVFPSARATVETTELLSREVPFVRQFTPEERIYLQKRVSFRDDDKAVVEITLQNFGRRVLEETRIKDFLEENDLFSEISVIPESKGVWLVPQLRPGDEFVVQYVTESGQSLNRLPALFGAGEQTVLRSIVIENVVNEAWEFVQTNGIELFGISLLILLPIVSVVGRKLSWW